jgi:hypothetical protein
VRAAQNSAISKSLVNILLNVLGLVLFVEGEDIDCGLPFEDLPAHDA